MDNSWESCKKLRSSSCVPKDRISELPDSIIQHILSFSDAKDAIKTCVLSKRWESLWTLVHSLLFHCERGEEDYKFATFVDKTLAKYASSKIKKFLIQCPLWYVPIGKVDLWIEFAVNHEVEELSLKLWRKGYMPRHYWPKPMYINSCVKKMSLYEFWPKGSLEGFYWTSLKILSLTNCSFDNGAIRSILGSPLIECLTFRECKLDNDGRLGVIDASCTSLKELVIIDQMCRQTDQRIDIVAPNLLVLTVSGFMHQSFNLVDVSSLVEANIDFSMGLSSYIHEKKLLKDLLQSVDHVNKLKVGIWCIQGNSSRRAIHAKFPSESHKVMEVDIISTIGCLLELSELLLSLPDLEQLTINLMPSDYFEFQPTTFIVENNCLRQYLRQFLIWHLRSVEIIGFAPGSCSDSDNILLELVQYLLGNAKVLQKLIINAEAESSSSAPWETFRKLYEITQKLLSFPRASRNAVVMFGSHLK